MKRSSLCAKAALATLLWVAAAEARADQFVATLSGDQEVPPTLTTGTGTASVLLDTTTDTLSVSMSFQDLLGPETSATINGPAGPGSTAPILYTLTVTPSGDISGTVNEMIPLVDLSGYTVAQQIGDLRGGLWYVEVDSTLFPGSPGEIRGQLTSVPEPSALLLMGIGLIGSFACRRRIRRA